MKKLNKSGGHRVMRSEYIQVKKLENWGKNPREIDDRMFRHLCDYLQKHGQLSPLLVDSRDRKTVLGGNMRLKAMKKMGWDKAEVKVIEIKSDEEAIEVALLDNAAFGKYLLPKLAELKVNFDFKLSPIQINLAPIQLKDLNLENNINYENKEIKTSEFNNEKGIIKLEFSSDIYFKVLEKIQERLLDNEKKEELICRLLGIESD